MTPNEALKNMPPSVKDACIEWMDYKAELGKRMAKKTRERYMEDFESYVAGYGIVAVQALIDEAIRNGNMSIAISRKLPFIGNLKIRGTMCKAKMAGSR